MKSNFVLMVALSIAITAHYCVHKPDVQELLDKWNNFLGARNNDLRKDLFPDVKQIVYEMIDTMKKEMDKINDDKLGPILDSGLQVFAGMKETVDKIDTKTELGELTKELLLTLVDYFTRYFNGVKAVLNGESNSGIPGKDEILEIILRIGSKYFELVDGFIQNNQNELGIENLNEECDINKVAIKGTEQIGPDNPLGPIIFEQIQNFVLRITANVALNIVLLEDA